MKAPSDHLHPGAIASVHWRRGAQCIRLREDLRLRRVHVHPKSGLLFVWISGRANIVRRCDIHIAARRGA